MAEMTWIEKHFYNQALDRGGDEGRSETLNAAIDFMRPNGMSIDKVNDFKKSVLNNN